MKVYKILAIDDEVMFVDLVKMNLEKEGQFEVRVETNPNNALSAALEFKPDVILLDYIMPEKDGGEVAAQFSVSPDLKHIPVIMMTALMSPEETDELGYKETPTGIVLPKPISVEVLKTCIKKFLGEE